MGRWDRASLVIFMTDWEAPGALVVARGDLGEVSVSGEAFEAELKGPTAALERPVVEQTSPECRASFGDKRCRVDMAGRVRLARVVMCEDAVMTVDASEPSPKNAYVYGRARWIGGSNSGLTFGEHAADGPEPVTVEISQLGTHATSRPAMITIP